MRAISLLLLLCLSGIVFAETDCCLKKEIPLPKSIAGLSREGLSNEGIQCHVPPGGSEELMFVEWFDEDGGYLANYIHLSILKFESANALEENFDNSYWEEWRNANWDIGSPRSETWYNCPCGENCEHAVSFEGDEDSQEHCFMWSEGAYAFQACSRDNSATQIADYLCNQEIPKPGACEASSWEEPPWPTPWQWIVSAPWHLIAPAFCCCSILALIVIGAIIFVTRRKSK